MNTTFCTRTLVLMSACALFILPSCRWRKKDGDMLHKENRHSARRRIKKEQPVKAANESVHRESRRTKRRAKAVAAKPASEKKAGFWSWFGGSKKEGTEKTMTRAERRAHKNAAREAKKAANGAKTKQHVPSAKEKMNDGHGNPNNSRYNK